MACSFTKAAAVELATKEVDGRKADIPRQMIGTLHSLCYRALEMPPLAEGHVGDFNAAHPEYLLSEARKPDVEDLGAADGGEDGTSSDKLSSHYQLLRARCVDRDAWPIAVQGFARAWEGWKDSHGAFDFTDLIEHGPATPPGNPKVLFADETQDFNALEMQLLRRWVPHLEAFVCLLDDDQTIFSHSGADPRVIVDAPVPAENRIVLKQSYRLPRAVHRYASVWIAKVSRRQAKEFLPRDADGAVTMADASLRFPGEEMARVKATVDQGKSVMVLASCGYMLNGWIAALRDAGVPFANPYRPNRGSWNPLNRSEGGAAQRVSSFVAAENGQPYWTMFNMAQWCGLLKAEGLLKRGAKAEIARLGEDQPSYRPGVAEMLERWLDGPLAAMVAGAARDGTWPSLEGLRFLGEHAMAAKQKPVSYAGSIAGAAIARGGNPRLELAMPPKVCVGTVHSTKGAEADVVYLAPDLSPQAAEAWHRSAEGRDEVRRVFYVGITRAREELRLLRPGGRLSVDF